MKQLLSFVGSMKTMSILMLFFAFVIGYATIIENDYGTLTAKAEIYNAKWFEALMALLAINLVINIFRYKMYKLKNINIFIFHIAFLIILFGAGITRYVGFEGTMHIREGQTASFITSADNYFGIDVMDTKNKKSFEEKVFLSKKGGNSFNKTIDIDGKKVDIELLSYIPNAVEGVVASKNGKPVLSLMVTGGGKGQSVFLKEGDFYDAGSFILDFNSHKKFNKNTINIFTKDAKLYFSHNETMTYLHMNDRSTGNLKPSKIDELTNRTLFSLPNGGGFVLRKFYEKATTDVVTNPKMKLRAKGIDALKFRVSVDGKAKDVMVFGQAGTVGKKYFINIDGLYINLAYGSKIINLPFGIKLDDFQLDRYPGSMSPASYASEVTLIDNRIGKKENFRIYMNHILEYDGYRFFQSSYDPDEKGTILSVNNDPGTIWAYVGYSLLAIGMFWTLFSKKHRVAQLLKKAQKARDMKALSFMAMFVLMGLYSPTYAMSTDEQTAIAFSKVHADKFGTLVVQDSRGRMKPVDTLSREILAKLNRSSSINLDGHKLDANQVILGMMIRPDVYKNLKIIRTHNKYVNKILGVAPDTKYVAFTQFFTDVNSMRGYKIAKEVDTATRKAPKDRNKFDKEMIKVDERVNVAYMVYTGSILKIWPKPNDVNNKWFGTIEALKTFEPKYADEVRDVAMNYFSSIDKALQTGDWATVDKNLDKIKEYQHKYGSMVMPSQDKIDVEILYNHTNIFETIYPYYLIMGFILLILSFVKIIKPSFKLNIFTKTTFYMLVVLFIAHTFGLALRWFISGHAPWSNGYESMIYIGWATVLAGFIFSRKSSITLAATSILTGLILFVAHLNWMNPQVTNLVPVLNSYWLSIHVSMITASYGFLGLGALLGFITLLLFIFKNSTNEKHISLSIKELNAINEMSLIAGLVLLTVGNFLGGVWANESWGRYWGWDPKETWALVTILVYSVVIHVRFMKSIYSEFNYTVISLLSFTSVLMTYFGVNYYLKGLHSYAQGDEIPIPDFVPISYGIIFVIILLAYRNRKLA